MSKNMINYWLAGAHFLCFASSVHPWTLDAIRKRESKFRASAKGWHIRVPHDDDSAL